MILGKLDLTESAEMEFEAEIFGTVDKPTSIRFVIEGNEFEIGCKCIEENNTIKVQVPRLKGILPSGVYETRLEVVINDKLFIPMREDIEFNPNVELDVKSKGITSVKEGIKITPKSRLVSEDSKKNVAVENAIKEGYDVVKMNNFTVLKHKGMYCGLVNGRTIIKADKEYNTLSEMVDSLDSLRQ